MQARINVVGIVLLTGLLAGCKQSASTPAPDTATSDSEYQEIAQALKTGESIACTMTDAQGMSTRYLAKGAKSRVEGFQTDESTKNGTMINDGEYMYVWNDGETQGTKFSLATAQEAQSQAQEYINEMPNLSTQEARDEYESEGYTVDCQQEAVADSEFAPPSGVTFTDLSAMMQGAMETLGNTLESLPEDMSPEVQEQLQKLQIQQ